MSDYIKHILDQRRSNIEGKSLSYCGIDIAHKWTFTGIDHAVATLDEGGRFLPCKKCANKIISILKLE